MGITSALTGLAYLRDFTKWVGDMRSDAEILTRTNDAYRVVGDVQGELFKLREENLRLLDENRVLIDKLRAAEDWDRRRAAYQLVEAPGGAHVLRSADRPNTTLAERARKRGGSFTHYRTTALGTGAAHARPARSDSRLTRGDPQRWRSGEVEGPSALAVRAREIYPLAVRTWG